MQRIILPVINGHIKSFMDELTRFSRHPSNPEKQGAMFFVIRPDVSNDQQQLQTDFL